MLQTARFDGSVLEVMQGANKVLTQINAKVNMDQIDDLKDEMAENQAHADEIGDMFAEGVNEDKDELADELDAMMAEEAMDELAMPGMEDIKPVPGII